MLRALASRTEFYAIIGVDEHVFAPFRVTWKAMGSHLDAAVLSEVDTPYGRKPLLSTHTTSLIATRREYEAHYLCALLNSEVVDRFIRSFSAAGRGFGAPSVIANVAIPKYDGGDPRHRELARLSLEAHKAVAAGQSVDELQEKVNQAARRLWNIES
jgi:hypothetical protein